MNFPVKSVTFQSFLFKKMVEILKKLKEFEEVTGEVSQIFFPVFPSQETIDRFVFEHIYINLHLKLKGKRYVVGAIKMPFKIVKEAFEAFYACKFNSTLLEYIWDHLEDIEWKWDTIEQKQSLLDFFEMMVRLEAQQNVNT